VRTRTRYISVIRAVLRRDGVRVPSGGAATFGPRVQALALSAPQHRLVAPLLALLRPLNQQLAILEAQLARGVAVHAAARRLCTVPGVGPVTAAAVVATLDDVGRFASAGQVAAYLGLVPRERSSGEQQRRGPLTKAGNNRVRWLLVQAAWPTGAVGRRRGRSCGRGWSGSRTARAVAGGGRAGAAARAHSLCGLARWDRVQARPPRRGGVGASGRPADVSPAASHTGRGARRDVRPGAERAPKDRWRPAPADSPNAPATDRSPPLRARIEGCPGLPPRSPALRPKDA
jgi:hypothetical protein